MLTEMGSPSGATCSKSISSPGMHPISNNLIDISLFSNFLMTAFCPGFNSVSFIIAIKAKYADLLLLTIYEIMVTSKEINIRFFANGLSLSLTNRRNLKYLLEKIIKSKGKRLDSISYIFCSDKELLKLNNKFLGHNYYTDILTFDLSESKNEITAEIFISLDRVRENAAQFKSSLKKELHRVIIHGVLHLCGYADKNKTEMIKMRKAEDKYLSLYFK